MVNSVLQGFALLGAMICELLLTCTIALAGETSLELGMGQYAHRAWTIGEGGIDSPIHAIAQTSDGYLWLGTQAGLWRFDGVRAVRWRAPDNRHLPGKWIQSLLATRDGTLWIGTDGGLVSWRAGKLTDYPALAGLDVLALLVDKVGTIWVGTESRATSAGVLCAIVGNAVHCYGRDGSLGARIYFLYEDGRGRLWFTSSSGVWSWRAGKPKLYPMRDTITGYFQSLTASARGGVLVSGPDGLRQIVGDEVRVYPLPGVLPQGSPPWVFTDRDGALWIGTIGSGVRYVHAGRMDTVGKPDGLSGNQVTRMFEDREGNVWVITKNGFDEFWKVAAAGFSEEPNLSDGNVTSVLSDVDGSVWFAMRAGLYRVKDRETTVYRGRVTESDRSAGRTARSTVREIIVAGFPIDSSGPLFQDRRGRVWLGSPSGLGYLLNDRFTAVPEMPRGEITCITEDDAGNLWVAHRELGLFRVSPDGHVTRFAWADLGIGETWSIVFDPKRRGLWLGSILGEVAFFANGRLRASYTIDGLGKRGVRDLRLDPDGTVWAATEGGLVRLSNGRLATLNSENGLPCDIVHATFDDNIGSIWIYTACGLVRVARSELIAWSRGTLRGQLGRILILGASDGVRSSSVWHFSPKIANSLDGRLWLASSTGAVTVNPRRLYVNALPPPVHVEQVIADRKFFGTSSPVRLPPLVRDIEIEYTALSFVSPGSNQFRYKLEGRDQDWQDAGNRRQAFYSDLAPGKYKFRVIASNNSGVWNDRGATLEFSVAPAYWQTVWFRVLCAAVLMGLAWMIYRIRMQRFVRAMAHEQEVEQRQRELQTELEHANRLATIGQLTASIIHEVRQPITGMLSSGYAARRWLNRENSDEVRQAIEAMINEGTRASEVIDGLRAMAKKVPPRKARFDMNDAIHEVINITQDEAAKNNVLIEPQLAKSLPLVLGDRVQLQQVVLNLIVNAIEALSGVTDGPKNLVIKTASPDPHRVSVAVQDSGPGLDPVSADRSFEPFYTTKPQGMGMGLSICRTIVEAHGGTLAATANLPRGTIFEFYVTVP